MTNDTDPNDSIEPSGVDRRGFLKRTAAFGAAVTGLSLATDDARAARKEIVVTATGEGTHYYEIHLEDIVDSIGSPSIGFGPDAEPNGDDEIRTVTANGDRHEMVEGRVRGNRQGAWLVRNEDNYFYTGEIDYIIADGNLEFEFPSGAFRTADDDRIQIDVWARESGRHSYNLSAQSGDIDKIDRFTGSGDRDLLGPSSERADTGDDVNGSVWNNNRDSYLLRDGEIHAINTIGNVRIEVGDQ